MLGAEEVLASSAAHFPTILEALAERRGADADLLAAEGAFDLVFGVDGSSRTAGFYDGSVIDGGVRQNFGPLGSSAYAGYRLSDGTFPIYEDANFTSDRGELKVGVLFSLLRDRDIDDRRFRRTDARLAIREATLDVLLTRVGVQQRALAAYWRWVTAGRQLEVYDTLLAIALERESGLEEQVRSGALAEIFLVENGQNITRRQRLAASARRDFQSAGLALSFYYRDANGEPQLPGADRLPPTAPIGELESLAVGAGPGMMTSIMQRPELAILRTAIERAQNRIALAENSMKPRVDLNFELSHGLGSIAEGGPSRDSTDAAMRLSFSVPLQRRAARGRIARERAEVEILEQRERLQLDRLEVEVQDIVLALDVAEELLRLAAAGGRSGRNDARCRATTLRERCERFLSRQHTRGTCRRREDSVSRRGPRAPHRAHQLRCDDDGSRAPRGRRHCHALSAARATDRRGRSAGTFRAAQIGSLPSPCRAGPTNRRV